MGNAVASGVSSSHSPSALLRLRRGKKSTGCPCFLSEHASTWEALTLHDKFRPYVLRHLLDEGFICSLLEHGEREHALTACEGVLYYTYLEETQRGILREKLEAWQRAAGSGVTECEGLNSESAFGELQLARPLRAHGFLPILQRRLAVLRELGAAVAEEHRSRCRPFHMRLRSPPPSAGGEEQGDVRLALMMNAVALQSLSTLAALAAAHHPLPSGGGNGRNSNVDLIRAPFAMLADMLEQFPPQNLFKYWSPLPSEPERRVSVDPETATASCSASLAHLAVTGGLHVGWKSSSTGASVITWQVALSEPATELSSVTVQWGAGDPATVSDQNALPLALSIEASVDGGREWHGITGCDEAVDVAHSHKASPGSSQHRYPVTLLALQRQREPHRKDRERRALVADPAVTHIRLKMKGAPTHRSGGALRIYDVAINARDPSASPSDVMTVLRQVQTFLLAQHSQHQPDLQEYVLRSLLGVCQASCALEFELDLVRVYMDMEGAAISGLEEGAGGEGENILRNGTQEAVAGDGVVKRLGREKRLQAFVSTLLLAACRARRQACRQDRQRVVQDAGFDPTMSSKWVVISEGGALVSSADSGHSHSLLHQCLRRGVWSWELALERESSGDETTCVGVAVNPVINSCYEDSHQMWMVRCYSGETYSNGGRRSHMTCKIHPLDSVRLTLNCDAGTLALEVNGADQGVVFANIPPDVHPAVCFYGITKSVRLVELKRICGDSDSDASDSEDESDAEVSPAPAGAAVETVPLSQHVAGQATTSTASGPEIPDLNDTDIFSDTAEDADGRKGSRVDGVGNVQHRSRVEASTSRRGARREEEAVAFTIRAAIVDSPSAGLLASLANFAQWYVPRGQEDGGGDQHVASAQRADIEEVERERMVRTQDPYERLIHTVGRMCPATPGAGDDGWGMAASGEPLHFDERRYSGRPLSVGSTHESIGNTNVNDPWQHVGRGGQHSSRLRGMMMGRPLPTRRMSSSAAGTSIPHGVCAGADFAERRRRPGRVSAAAESVGAIATAAALTRGSKGRPLPLEEPYIIQPTAAVFQKLYDLLVRLLSRLQDGADSGTASAVLSLLQIMRANFCRLVDAHVDPAEVGLVLDYDGQQPAPYEASESCGRDGRETLLPNILRCLQGVMLQQGGDPLLQRATVDTFTSGLPLLMPRVEDRLHLLLGLVRHLQSNGGERGGVAKRLGASKGRSGVAFVGHDETNGLAQIPRERVTLLRDLLKHFARTESVLQLLTLFEEEETERDAISDLLELMVTSMADKACLSTRSTSQPGNERDIFAGGGSGEGDTFVLRDPIATVPPGESHPAVAADEAETRSRSCLTDDGIRARVHDGSTGYESYWEELVAGGAGGTTLNFTLLDTCQQHLLCMVLNREGAEDNPHEILLCQYGQCLIKVCCRVLREFSSSIDRDSTEDDETPSWQLVGVLLPPFLHGLCMCTNRPRIAEGLLPPLVCLSEVLSNRISQNPAEAAAASLAEGILRQTQLANPEEGLALAPSGWHPVRASFEVDKDSMTSFAISEDGQLYSALTSSNTCALVDVGVSQGKAAWEFLLEDDSPSDECSVFGIATKPPYSRCYNSSQSLWMRRAYNGVLYNRGHQLPVAQSMSKIHPGDVVRCEVDMDEGTMRFSVNGEKQEGGFDGVEGEVFPCAGSYRSGVTIRLLKMEIMGGIGLRRGGDDNGVRATGWDPTEISWAPAPCSKLTRGGLVSIDKKAIETKRMTTPCVLRQTWASRPAASGDSVCDAGGLSTQPHSVVEGSTAAAGSDDTLATLTDAQGRDLADEGAMPGRHVDGEPSAAMREFAEAEAWEWVSVRTTRGFAAVRGKHSVEMEVTPVGSRRRRAGGNSRPCDNESRNNLRRYPMAFGLCTGSGWFHDCPIGWLKGSWGWWTDGSLRAHGEILIPRMNSGETSNAAASETLYGSEFLPLKPFDVITMVIDTRGGTLRYVVNGVDAGIAFGPPGSGAVCELADDKAPFAWRPGSVLFPSCSLTNDKQVVQIRPGGTLGTQLLPLSVDLHKTVASLAGRLCATMVAGAPQDEAEVALEPWLRSPLLSGGVQASEDIMGLSAWRSLGRRSWDEARSAEQQGRLVRTRSFLAWGRGHENLPRPGIPRSDSDYPATVAEEELAANCGQSRLLPGGDVRLTAQIMRATNIPQGLVLWPDDQCVRLTATVDGRDVSSEESVLNIATPSSEVTTSKVIGAAERTGVDGSSKGGTEPALGDNETQAGQTQLVVELQMPNIRAAGGDDQQSEPLPAFLLRVEALVGRVVTARGSVDLSELLKKSLSQPSSTRTVLRLSGGGEIVFVLTLSWVSFCSASEREEVPQGQTGVLTPPSASERCGIGPTDGSSDATLQPAGACVERFLSNVASWGLDEGVCAATSDNSKSSPGVLSGVEGPSVGMRVGTGDDSGGGNDEETRVGSCSRDDSVFPELVEWLGQSHPDPPFLRKALEKTGNYSFPLVEAPFLAALLKHGSLVGEAFQAAGKISTKGEEGSPLLAPTKDMAKLWGRVRQLRAYLRTQRQGYKVMAADGLPGGGDVASPVPDGGTGLESEHGDAEQGEAGSGEEKNDAGPEMEEKEEPSGKALRSTDHIDREIYPATFADLCRQLAERAKFLLELAPSTIQSPTAAAEGTSILMHHLAEELSDLPTPPPARLQSRLLRWRSEDRGKERGKGVVDVLRAQSQLRRSSSLVYRPRAKSLGNRPVGLPAETMTPNAHSSERNLFNPCIQEGQGVTGDECSEGDEVARTLTGSLGQFDGDSLCNSGDESDDSGKGALLDDETAASAAMQACTIYVMTGGAVAPPRVLRGALRSRTVRASMRMFGLEALAALLRTVAPEGRVAMSIGAPSVVQEALVFLRPAFQGVRVKGGNEGREVEITKDERDPRHHYLKGLEGCSTSLLTGVQSAFEDLYRLLRTLLDHSLRTRQPGLAHVLMTSWALDFESRDYRFLVHESGILPTLQAMVTLTNTAGMASATLAGFSKANSGQKEGAIGKGAAATVRQGWNPWSLENIREGYIQGTLMARDLARHISDIPPSAVPSGFLEEAGLHGSASDILGRHSMASLMRRYSALLRVHLTHAEAKLEKVEQATALKRKRLEKVARERVAQMVSRGVPVLDERESRKAPEVHLTALCSWATVAMVESVACTFARGVTYVCTPAGEACAAVPHSPSGGNYFEVTVMNPGEKTTIGVGLADPDVFPATKQMPGWVDHSYGYHGDDGRKFGRGKTDSIWPTWVDGDVIGCGFDSVRGAIWYTRNGKLLGDGFVPVYEPNLAPVVGFHSNGESVRVNFGVTPFTYEGSEVVVAPAVLAERELLQRDLRSRNLKPEEMRFGDDSDMAADEEKKEGALAEEKEPNLEDHAGGAVEQLTDDSERDPDDALGEPVHELSPDMMMPSMKVLQRGASSLLRFLVAVSMRQASLASVIGSEQGLHCSLDDAPSRAEDARQVPRGGQETLNTPGKGADRTGSLAAAVAWMPTRERSMYGTPFKQMQMHVDNLHQDLFDLVLRELRLGALSLEHILSTSPDRAKADGRGGQNRLALDNGVEPSWVGKPIVAVRSVKPEMQRSYSHGCRPVGIEWSSRIAWRGVDGTGEGDREREDATAKDLDLVTLEIGEVEPHVFRQLALLCSMRQYAVVRAQLTHPSALRSIFSLLKVGSPRMQRCVLLLLSAVLPGVGPSVVDACLPEAWKGREQTNAPTGSTKSASRKDEDNGAACRSPCPFDGLVGVLFSTVREAYSPPTSVPEARAVEGAGSVDAGTGSNQGYGSLDCSSAKRQRQSRGQGCLAPGCDQGFGGGMLELSLAEQCSSLLRKLYEDPAWKELIARKLLLSIRAAASTIRENSSGAITGGSPTDSRLSTPVGELLWDVMSDAVAALAIIAGSSGVLYPGATVLSRCGAYGTVVLFCPGDAEAGVVFDGENVEACEEVLVRDLEAVGVGFQADPDTPAQPVVAQLISLLGALLQSPDVSLALKVTDRETLSSNIAEVVWARVLSQTLRAVHQLAVHCSDAVVAACQEGDVGAQVLPTLLEVAICPIQLPALITAQDFGVRWRAAQARLLSARRLGAAGLRTLQPIQRRSLPPREPSTVKERIGDAPGVEKVCHTQSPSGSRDALSAEESREETLVRPQRHAEYGDPVLDAARSTRAGGRGRLTTLGDAHRSWGRGWGSAMSGRRVVGVRGAVDWMGRSMREEDDPRREGGRRRLLRSDLSHRMSARGRRAASAESRLDPRRPTGRVFHEHDRLGGFAETRDEDSGALLVEFNDGTDEPGREAHGVEAGSAGSADSGDTSQDGDEEEVNTCNVNSFNISTGVDRATDTEHTSRPSSPEGPYCASGQGGMAPSVQRGADESALDLKPRSPSPGFPISHVLEFDAEARAERKALSARLSSDLGVPESTALAALEAFGVDTGRARQWLSMHLSKQAPTDALRTPADTCAPSSVGGDVNVGELNGDDDALGIAADNAVVSSLIGTGDAEPAGGGEAASVPLAEEGFNLWEPEADEREASAPRDAASTQYAGLLCEHDLVPVLGFPRPAAGVGGPAGSVTTSFLVREVDVLVPGSLLMVTTGEGYAPDELCPCATVASEMDGPVALKHAHDEVVVGVSTSGGGAVLDETNIEGSHVAGIATHVQRDDVPFAQGLADGAVMDGAELLVEMMDAETGLCLGKRVPMGELRHSTTFFGRELDAGSTTVRQVMRDTDIALAIHRARSLLVCLIHSLPTPAITAAGGPRGLLNITRLLAAQDLAKGISPASMGIAAHGDGNDVGQSAVGSVAGEQQRETGAMPKSDKKLVDTPQPDQDSLLKVLWRKVMESPEQWVSNENQGAASTALGEMLAQEVLDSFKTLTTMPQIMLSGDWAQRETSETRSLPLATGTSTDKSLAAGGAGVVLDVPESTLATQNIVHESLHPLSTPLSYGGHIKVDPSCHGMVVKLDSRSRTSSDLLRLQFFSSRTDMLSGRDPLRVMHGHVAERAARARAKGMEFFKIEEADSTSFDTASPRIKDTLSSSALDRLALPPALVRQSSTSTTASLSSPTPVAPAGTSRRPVLTSGAMTKAMYEVHSQMVARRKARLKESPVPTSQGSSFRSFALPGIVELWFRFDAPPGAEKPPLQIVPLAGSINLVPPGTVQASAGAATGPDVRTRSNHDEDLTQEELGLQALFTCFGDDHVDDACVPTETSGKGAKSVDSDDRSKSSEAMEQFSAELPACLATPADVSLTSGKWFYEATIESLLESTADDGEVDGCPVRIGWAHTELAASLQRGGNWKVGEGSLAWDTGALGVEHAAGTCAVSEASDGRLRMPKQLIEGSRTAGHDEQPGQLIRPVSCLSESVESSLAVQKSQGAGANSTGGVAALSSNGSGEDSSLFTQTETNEHSTMEATSRRVAFPILGSDANNLGFGLGQEGYVWLGGCPRVRATDGFAPLDVVGCAFDVDSGKAWFSVNGRWTGGGTDAQENATMKKPFGWGNDVFVASSGFRPCFSLRGKSSVSVNFGATPFKYPPPGREFLAVVLRDVQAAKEERPGLAGQIGDHRVAFAPEVAGHSSRSPSKSNPAASGSVSEDWGFRFVVDPLRGIHYRVVRELELVCRFGEGARGGSGPSTAGSISGSQAVSIWRPKAPPGWFSVGDVACRGLLPPAGAVVVRADTTGCTVSKPAKFRVVHQDKTTGYVVWRPVARKGQVSLGDFACAKKASKSIMAGAVRCVAAWAVEACPVVQCLWRAEKQSGTQALWSVQNGLGTFFGSQTGGRMGKKEVTQGPQSRAERHKRKKKKKKKKGR